MKKLLTPSPYAIARHAARQRNAEIHKVINGLLSIAKLAMPDTYFATDSRVRRAKKWIKENP